MRRDEALTVLGKPASHELLASAGLLRLAYTGRDGYPRVVTAGFVWDGSDLIICTAENAPKVAALRRDPRVAVTNEGGKPPPGEPFFPGEGQWRKVRRGAPG